MSSFKDLRIVDNFYQTSSYIPMPTVLVSTLAEDGCSEITAKEMDIINDKRAKEKGKK